MQPSPLRGHRVITPRSVRIGLLDADPELCEAVPLREREEARTQTRVPGLELTPGEIDFAHLPGGTNAALVVDGLLSRDVVLGERLGTSLLGPGDVVPFGRTGAPRLLDSEVRWTAATTVRLALLGPHLDPAVRRWPQIAGELVARAADQAARSATHQAIAQLPRVEDRLVALLLHLGEHWGTMTPEGLVLPLPLTHEALGRLIGARRPTVSLAMKALGEQGRAIARTDAGWVLAG